MKNFFVNPMKVLKSNDVDSLTSEFVKIDRIKRTRFPLDIIFFEGNNFNMQLFSTFIIIQNS